MMPVLSPQQLREADAWTMVHEPISSAGLMERAAGACVQRVERLIREGRLGRARAVVVVAGMGNNGGDGLVMARLFHRDGFPAEVVLIMSRAAGTPDHALNLERAVAAGIPVHRVRREEELPVLGDCIIVDAIFGTGLNEPLRGLPRRAVRWMNASGCPIVSIDMPSGLFAESNAGNDPEGITMAAVTLTLEVPKLSLLLPENAAHVGRWELVPIGLDQEFLARIDSPYHVLNGRAVRSLIRPRPRFSHKGSFGHAWLLGGATGRMGAMVLAARAALRSGAGLVTAGVPDAGIPVLQATAPEAMCATGLGEDRLERLPGLEGCTAIGVGPGLGTDPLTVRCLAHLLDGAQLPVVIDADALNILAATPELLARLPERSVLTPHPKEFERLAGRQFATGYDRLQAARKSAADWRSIVVLKGAHTAVCLPDGRVRFNATGNPGMAKGGSGDALTGLLAGLLAQGMSPEEACSLGVHLHGLAGDIAAERHGERGMTALDLVESLPAAWKRLEADEA